MSRKLFVKSLFVLSCLLINSNLASQNLYLNIIGETELQTKVIDSIGYNNTFKDYSSLTNEIETFNNTLNNIGYLDKVLLSYNKKNDSTYTAIIDIGKIYKYIKIYHNKRLDNIILKLVSNEFNDTYFIVPLYKLESTLNSINEYESNLNDPFAILKLNIIEKKQNYLEAQLSFDMNASRKIDKIVVKGYEKFPKSYIKHYLKIKEQQKFNLDKIKNKLNNLENLQFTNQLKDPEALFTRDSTILYMYLEKVKSNFFDGFLGFGTNETTNKIEFDGYLNLSLINNLNYGESLKLNYKSDENEQKTFNVNAILPYIFNSPIGIEANINIFKKDSTFFTVSQDLKINYQINPKSQIAVGINTINSSDLLNQNTLAIQDYQSNFYTLNYNYYKLQKYDKLFPVNFAAETTFGLGSRTYNSIDESQEVYKINIYKIFNLNFKNSLYFRVNSAILKSNSFLENELFRFGGINSIRGFEENSIVADLYSVLNTEYRYKLNNTLYIHSVIDAAYFENESLDIKSKLFGFGFGFGLLTNSGLFKLNFSSGKSENQKFKISDSKVHLSLSTFF
jgi:outer membrane protein assembly factor BamA